LRFELVDGGLGNVTFDGGVGKFRVEFRGGCCVNEGEGDTFGVVLNIGGDGKFSVPLSIPPLETPGIEFILKVGIGVLKEEGEEEED